MAVGLVKHDNVGVLRKRKMVEMMMSHYVAFREVSGYLLKSINQEIAVYAKFLKYGRKS